MYHWYMLAKDSILMLKAVFGECLAPFGSCALHSLSLLTLGAAASLGNI